LSDTFETFKTNSMVVGFVDFDQFKVLTILLAHPSHVNFN